MNAICDVYQSLSIPARMLVFIVLAPFVGGFLAGVDRKLSARLQGRYGPPLRQPFFDVLKLFQKERILVNKFQNFTIVLFFLFILLLHSCVESTFGRSGPGFLKSDQQTRYLEFLSLPLSS